MQVGSPQIRSAEFREIPVSSIVVTKLQIRKFYDKDKMRELVRSIRIGGVMQGIVVRPYRGNRFELVFGSRRLKGAKRSGEKTIPALIRSNLEDKDVIIMALSENLQRQDLEPFEEAKAILRLLKEYKMPIQEVALKIGRHSGFIKKRLKLLKMPKEVQQLVADGKIPVGHVDMLASFSISEQRKMAQDASTQGLSQREFQVHIEESQPGSPTSVRKARKRGKNSETGWNSEKLKLRIKDFTRFIKSVRPIILDMGPIEIHNIRLALEGLSKEATSAVEEFKSFSKV